MNGKASRGSGKRPPPASRSKHYYKDGRRRTLRGRLSYALYGLNKSKPFRGFDDSKAYIVPKMIRHLPSTTGACLSNGTVYFTTMREGPSSAEVRTWSELKWSSAFLLPLAVAVLSIGLEVIAPAIGNRWIALPGVVGLVLAGAGLLLLRPLPRELDLRSLAELIRGERSYYQAMAAAEILLNEIEEREVTDPEERQRTGQAIEEDLDRAVKAGERSFFDWVRSRLRRW